jgi:uncharacterized membrane protein YkoI
MGGALGAVIVFARMSPLEGPTMKVMPALAIALFALALLTPVAVRAEEKEAEGQKIAVKDIPKNIVDAVTAALPGGTITDAETETKDGKTSYELDVTKDGKTYEVKVDADGKVISQKEEKADDKKEGEKEG